MPYANLILKLILVVTSTLLGACASPEVLNTRVETSDVFSLEEMFEKPGKTMGCRQMFDAYCNSLHSPKAQGNLLMGKGAHAAQVFQGRTQNDFSAAFFFYAKAKLRVQQQLPADFRAALEGQDYFGRLERLLNRPAKAQMTLGTRIEFLRSENETDYIWNSALHEAVLKRMNSKFRGFHRLRKDEIPLEQAVARLRIRNELISNISRTIWHKDPNWKGVETSFELLRRHFLSVIMRLDIPEEIRRSWIERMSSVRLVIPGTIPESAESDCSTTQSNAFYYTQLNLITVCAGDFNTEGILQTVAHELAHALDIDRSRYLAQRNSPLGQGLMKLRSQVCSSDQFSCSEWGAFKDRFALRLEGLLSYRPELPDFQRCLQKKPTLKKARDSDLERIAGTIIGDQISDLASSGIFLRITKQKVPMLNGAMARNPNYLNPCAYKIWSQGEEAVDDESTQLLFFTAEYRCSQADPKSRLLQAIETSKQMATRLTKTTLAMEGEFSSRDALDSEGFSSPPSERFADVLGSYAFASYLSEVQDTWMRRYLFLASSSWQCEQPSLETLYPDESTAQRSFVFDAHTSGSQRKMESFSRPMQEALQCNPDFEVKSCDLRFKAPSTKREL